MGRAQVLGGGGVLSQAQEVSAAPCSLMEARGVAELMSTALPPSPPSLVGPRQEAAKLMELAQGLSRGAGPAPGSTLVLGLLPAPSTCVTLGKPLAPGLSCLILYQNAAVYVAFLLEVWTDEMLSEGKERASKQTGDQIHIINHKLPYHRKPHGTSNLELRLERTLKMIVHTHAVFYIMYVHTCCKRIYNASKKSHLLRMKHFLSVCAMPHMVSHLICTTV